LGTQTLGYTQSGAAGHFIFEQGAGTTGAIMKAHSDTSNTGSVDIYVDTIHAQVCPESGGTQTIQFAIYGTGGTLIGVATNSASAGAIGTNGNLPAWIQGSFNAGGYLHIPANSNIVGAARNTGTGGLYMCAYNDSGSFDFYSSSSGFPSSWGGSNKVWGGMPWYATYFPAATITSVTSTPVFPGQAFTVNGLSYSAGVLAVKVNGVTCSGVSVVNDTQLTATVPAGATTGTVEVDTNAGNATSSGVLTISGGRIFHSGALVSAASVRVFHSSALVNIQSIRTAKNVSGSLVLTDVH
jgi:hypothetical protein